MANFSAMNLGFTRNQVEEALKASNNNPDMALTFLEGGDDSIAQQFTPDERADINSVSFKFSQFITFLLLFYKCVVW